MKTLLICLSALLVTATLASSLEGVTARKQLVLGTDPQYAPFESRNEKGDVVGFDVDLGALIAAKLNVKLKLQPTVLELLPAALGTGRVDLAISGLVAKPEWKKQVSFSEVYFDNSQVYAVRSGNPTKLQLSSPRGRTIGVRTNTIGFLAADEQLRPRGAKLQLFNSVASGLEALRGGKLDAMILDAPSLDYLRRKQPGTFDRLEATLTSEQYVIAVKRGSDLLGPINSLIREWRGSREYTRMLERWIVEK